MHDAPHHPVASIVLHGAVAHHGVGIASLIHSIVRVEHIVRLGHPLLLQGDYVRYQVVVGRVLSALCKFEVARGQIIVVHYSFSLKILLPFLLEWALPLPKYRSALV